MQVKDPVCGMMIESTTARERGLYRGETVYFCAASCKRTYERTHPPDPS